MLLLCAAVEQASCMHGTLTSSLRAPWTIISSYVVLRAVRMVETEARTVANGAHDVRRLVHLVHPPEVAHRSQPALRREARSDRRRRPRA